MAAAVTIRPEEAGDAVAVAALLEAAFPTPAEARLVERLRAGGEVSLALVAEREGAPAGHVLFSPLRAPFRALALAPLAVAAPLRRQGIGTALVEEGLARARAAGWVAAFVLGDPAYYSRFGFRAELASGFRSPYAGPYLMALPLQPGGFPVAEGDIAHAAAFADLA